MNTSPQDRPKAVIFDMDGTLVNVSSVRHHVAKPRGEKDFDAFHAASIDCPPVAQTMELAAEYHRQGYVIVVVTARVQKWFYTSLIWLHENMKVPFEGPFMRRDNDFRPDVEIKREIFAQITKQFDIHAAVDDNPAVIGLWMELGLQVTTIPGWEDFMTIGNNERTG